VVARNASRETGKTDIPDTQANTATNIETPAESVSEQESVIAQSAVTTKTLPKMVDLGAGKCIPCQMMEPILEELKEEYENKFEVVFIDVWENPSAGKEYGIRVIPTQIFYDTEGKERFRHEGFFSKEEILAKWDELGIAVTEED
jgi:thioredoxin 1